MNKKLLGYAAALFAALGAVNAQAAFLIGQDANGDYNPFCSVSCVMYWDAADGIEVLNNWSIGQGYWSATAAAGSAQALAEEAGFAATGVTGWVLPTGDGTQPAGPLNQWLSIWNQQNYTPTNYFYWSTSEFMPSTLAWAFFTGGGSQNVFYEVGNFYAFAIHPGQIGDAALPIPLPASAWLLISSIGGLGVFTRKRKV